MKSLSDLLNDKAASLYKIGEILEACRLAEQSLESAKQTYGADHSKVATSLNILAGLYKAQGRYSEVEPLYQEALAIRLKTLGPDHPDVAASINNLAVFYKSQGDYFDAEFFYRQALSMREKALGPVHVDVAVSLNNLAALYYSWRRYPEAETLSMRALQILEERSGKEQAAAEAIQGNLKSLLGMIAIAEEESKKRITEITRSKIFEIIIDEGIRWSGNLSEPAFLERIFDLVSMSPKDEQFENAFDEIWRLRVREHLWESSWIFADSRFDLLYCEDSVFLQFLCEMLHPEVRSNIFEVERLSEIFNEHLADSGYELVEQDIESDESIFIAKKHLADADAPLTPIASLAKRDYLSKLQKLLTILPHPGRTESQTTHN